MANGSNYEQMNYGVEIYSPDIVCETKLCGLPPRVQKHEDLESREKKGRTGHYEYRISGKRVQVHFTFKPKEDLLPVVAPHTEDLDHADENVDEIKLEADTLVDNVALHVTTLSKASVVQNLLDIIESEATEDSKTTVQPDALRPHQSAGSSGGKDHGSKTGEGNDGDTSEEGAAEVQVLLLLSGSTNEGNRAHHADSIETSASEDSRVHKHQRREESSLGQVEHSPAAVLQDVAIESVSTAKFRLMNSKGRWS